MTDKITIHIAQPMVQYYTVEITKEEAIAGQFDLDIITQDKTDDWEEHGDPQFMYDFNYTYSNDIDENIFNQWKKEYDTIEEIK